MNNYFDEEMALRLMFVQNIPLFRCLDRDIVMKIVYLLKI